MTENKLLPVGTYVVVREKGPDARPPYRAKVLGYDMGRTKYRLASEYMMGKFTDAGAWTFLSWAEAFE